MKRKKAMAFNAPGGTIEYIGASAQNLIQNGGYPAGISCNCGVDVFGGTDYSYSQFGGVPSKAFRKVFNPLDYQIIPEDLWDCIFKIGGLDRGCGVIQRPVLWFMGWRVVIEYFDVNAVVDFTGKIDDDAPTCDEAMRHFCDVYSGFDTRVVNEHLINIFAKL